jgi:hypothetical protein
MRAPLERLGRIVFGFRFAVEMEELFAELVRLNLRFVDEHDRDIVFDRVDAMALTALESLPIRGKLHWGFAQWTNKNIQQFLTHCHTQ